MCRLDKHYSGKYDKMSAVPLLVELHNSFGWIIRSFRIGEKRGVAELNAAKFSADALETACVCDKKASALSNVARMAADAGIFAMPTNPCFLAFDQL
jgi:hypothetical protein